jgi:hypothetical protein
MSSNKAAQTLLAELAHCLKRMMKKGFVYKIHVLYVRACNALYYSGSDCSYAATPDTLLLLVLLLTLTSPTTTGVAETGKATCKMSLRVQ